MISLRMKKFHRLLGMSAYHMMSGTANVRRHNTRKWIDFDYGSAICRQKRIATAAHELKGPPFSSSAQYYFKD